MTREPVDWPTTDLLAHRASTTPGRTALVDADEEWSLRYDGLDERVDAVAGGLVGHGVEPGETVGLLMENDVDVVELLHAGMRLRTTLVPLNAELTAAELEPQVRRAELDRLVCDANTASTAAEVFDPGRTLSTDGADIADVERLDRSVRALPDRAPVTRGWTQLVLFTSGTTGEPKGVRLTAGNLVASATASAYRLGVLPGDRWLAPLPMYHMGGLAPVVRAVLYGTGVVLQRTFDPTETARLVDAHGVTGMSLVPTMLTRLLDGGWSPPAALRFVLLGGAPASREVVDRAVDRGVPVHPTYGMTETASQVATATPEQTVEHPGTVGQPLVNTRVTVVDEDGDAVDTGATGELVVDGPTVTPGYLDEATTAAAFGPHGLRTGDVGYRDAAGRLWVLGRVDDTIVTGGENVHPVEVADAIRDHPDVEDVAVVGLEDPEWGERVGALVVGDVDVEGLASHCRDRLAPFKLPKTWGVADALPRTASGTVDREAVRERLREDVDGPARS